VRGRSSAGIREDAQGTKKYPRPGTIVAEDSPRTVAVTCPDPVGTSTTGSLPGIPKLPDGTVTVPVAPVLRLSHRTVVAEVYVVQFAPGVNAGHMLVADSRATPGPGLAPVDAASDTVAKGNGSPMTPVNGTWNAVVVTDTGSGTAAAIPADAVVSATAAAQVPTIVPRRLVLVAMVNPSSRRGIMFRLFDCIDRPRRTCALRDTGAANLMM
jgi:hypothetical protein